MKLLEKGWNGLFLSDSVELPHVTFVDAKLHLSEIRLRHSDGGVIIHIPPCVSKVKRRYAVVVSNQEKPAGFKTIKSMKIALGEKGCWVSFGRVIEVKSFLT